MRVSTKLFLWGIVTAADLFLGYGIWKTCTQSWEASALSVEKQVAITFDDGPHSIYTARLLDGLRERDVKASFFLLGQNIAGKEAIVQQMELDGHMIGNHGFSHVQMNQESVCEAVKQVEKTNDLVEEITGKRPEYFRPPFGSWSEEMESEVGMTVALWNLDSLDWKYQDTGKVTKAILKEIEPGDIILMHDVFPTSVEAALQVIDTLSSQGYTFVTADELLVD